MKIPRFLFIRIFTCKWLFTYFVACLLTLLLPSKLCAHSTPQASYNLTQTNKADVTERLRYFKFPQGQIPDNKSALVALTQGLDIHTSTNTFGDRFIAMLDVTNATDETDWFVYPSGAIVENIHIYTFRQDGEVESFATGHNHPNQIDHHYGGRIFIDKAETVTLVMLFDSDIYSSPVGISLMPYTTADSSLNKENLLLILSIGICIALALYNLFLYSGTRQSQYLYYSLATFGFTLGWAQAFGVFNFIFNVSPPEWIIIPFFFGFIFIALFTTNFLQLKTSSPKLDATLRLMALLSFFCLPVSFVSLGLSLLLASLFSSIILLVSLYSGIKSWRNNYSPAKYFVFALLAVLMPNIVGNFLNMGLLPGVEINVYLFSQLGNSLDSLLLAFALSEKVRIINEQNKSLTDELEERVKRRTEQLSGANQKLETVISELRDADNAKNVFLANMSHEIRTPLTSIIGYADGLLNNDFPPEERQNAIKVISQNGNHLVNIISDILDLTKVEAKKLEYEVLPTNLKDVLDQVADLLRVRAKEKGIDFIIDYRFPLPAAFVTDPTRLKQILFNLASNALKFTEKGYVSLTVSSQDNRVAFIIKDTGIGMTKQQLDKLFDPFEQGDKAISRKYGGTGLGLSISKHLIEDLGGEISVSSSLGEGSEFKFYLPITNHADIQWISQFDTTQQEEENLNQPLPDFHNVHVLLVDDHDQNRELISRLMAKMNIQVIQAKSGIQALDYVEKYSKIALILMDIQMPHMGGLETLERIREKGIDVPILALTANSMEHEVTEYLQKGFSAHLSKPLVREAFIEGLMQYLPHTTNEQGVLSYTDILDMSRDYFIDLKSRLTHFAQCRAQGDLKQMEEIAHAIKGSASSFGFQPYSELFAQIESAIKQQQQHKLSTLLIELDELLGWSVKLEIIDIPLGIVNHNYHLGEFKKRLAAFTPAGLNILAQLNKALDEERKSHSLIQLLKLKSECKKFGLATFVSSCIKMEKDLALHNWDATQVKDELNSLLNQLMTLDKVLGYATND